MSQKFKVAIPISEFPKPAKVLLEALGEIELGFFRCCLRQLSVDAEHFPIEDFFHDRIFLDEGVGYTSTTVNLYGEYVRCLESLIDILHKYLNQPPTPFKFNNLNLTDTMYVVELQYDPCHPPKRITGELYTR